MKESERERRRRKRQISDTLTRLGDDLLNAVQRLEQRLATLDLPDHPRRTAPDLLEPLDTIATNCDLLLNRAGSTLSIGEIECLTSIKGASESMRRRINTAVEDAKTEARLPLR